MKRLQVLLFNTNVSIQYQSFVCWLLSAYKYCYLILIFFWILFIHLHKVKWFQILLCYTNISILEFRVWVHHHHHHLVVPSAWISLILSRHSSLSFIASCVSSGLHPVYAQSCCIYVRAGHRAFARSCEEVHRSTSLMSSSLLLQQCLACLVCLNLIVFLMGGRWPYSCCFWGCYLVQYCSQHSCVVTVTHCVHPFS